MYSTQNLSKTKLDNGMKRIIEFWYSKLIVNLLYIILSVNNIHIAASSELYIQFCSKTRSPTSDFRKFAIEK